MMYSPVRFETLNDRDETIQSPHLELTSRRWYKYKHFIRSNGEILLELDDG